MGVTAVILLVVAFVLFVAGIAAAAIISDKRRREAFAQFAAGAGMVYSYKERPAMLARRQGLPLFKLGHSNSEFNFVTADDGETSVCLYDYGYISGHGKHRRHQQHTVCWFDSRDLQLPQFTLARRSFFHNAAEWFGYEMIELEDAPEFNERFSLRGANVEAIRRAFDPQVAKVCVECAEGYRLEGEGRQLVVYPASGRLPTAKLPAFLDSAYRIFAALK
jgi:hypothetical protein